MSYSCCVTIFQALCFSLGTGTEWKKSPLNFVESAHGSASNVWEPETADQSFWHVRQPTLLSTCTLHGCRHRRPKKPKACSLKWAVRQLGRNGPKSYRVCPSSSSVMFSWICFAPTLITTLWSVITVFTYQSQKNTFTTNYMLTSPLTGTHAEACEAIYKIRTN